MGDDNIPEELNLIIAEYANGLPNIINKVNAIWHSLKSHWDKDDYLQFRQLIHNLHGSAGMFGFNSVSEVAGKIEIIFRSSEDQTMLSEQEAIDINHLIMKLTEYNSSI
jgi:HPt (histidine-containing phosphotransfer) domain-containing protein